jgi:hypothetical protein
VCPENHTLGQNHTFGGCAANPNMPYRSNSIEIYFALLKAGEKVLTPVLPYGTPY